MNLVKVGGRDDGPESGDILRLGGWHCLSSRLWSGQGELRCRHSLLLTLGLVLLYLPPAKAPDMTTHTCMSLHQ